MDLSPDLPAAVRSELPFRPVLEFTGRALSSRPAELLRVAGTAHAHGDAIALDDVGADPLPLAFLPLVEPEVVKLDMHLVRHPHDPGTLATAAAVGRRVGPGLAVRPPRADRRRRRARPIDRTDRLRPPQRGLHLPEGTPFAVSRMIMQRLPY